MFIIYLKSSSSSTTFSSGSIGGNRGDVFDSSNLESASGQGSYGSLGTGSGTLGLGSSSGSELNMNSVDSDFLELLAHLLCGHHSSVRRGLFSIAGNLHTTSDSAVSFFTRNIGDVNEGIVPGGHNVGNSDYRLVVFGDLGSESLDGLVMFFVDFFVHVLRFINFTFCFIYE